MPGMTTQGHRRLVRLAAGVLATLAAVALAPADARASCGDYVIIGNPHVQGHMAHHAAMPEPAPAGMPMPGHGHKPCSGPRCSGAPPASPVQPVPPPAPVRGEDAGLASSPDTPFGQLSAAYRHEEPLQRPVRLASSVYHPPR